MKYEEIVLICMEAQIILSGKFWWQCKVYICIEMHQEISINKSNDKLKQGVKNLIAELISKTRTTLKHWEKTVLWTIYN